VAAGLRKPHRVRLGGVPAVTDHIRWQHDGAGEVTGRVGTLAQPVFRIWPPDDKGDCLLFVYLAGYQGDLYHGATPDELKGKAESLLSEFVVSLGAVFPEPIDNNDCPECGFGLPRHDKRCSRFVLGVTRINPPEEG
jgi:hypothetical protein